MTAFIRELLAEWEWIFIAAVREVLVASVALVMWMTLGLFTAALALLVMAVAAVAGVGP